MAAGETSTRRTTSDGLGRGAIRTGLTIRGTALDSLPSLAAVDSGRGSSERGASSTPPDGRGDDDRRGPARGSALDAGAAESEDRPATLAPSMVAPSSNSMALSSDSTLPLTGETMASSGTYGCGSESLMRITGPALRPKSICVRATIGISIMITATPPARCDGLSLDFKGYSDRVETCQIQGHGLTSYYRFRSC